MAFLFALILPFLTCVALVGTTALLWRAALPSVWSYVGLALLVVLGVHRVLQVAAEVIKLFTHGGYFLGYQKQPNMVELAERSFTVEAVTISVLVAVISWPLLSWLRSLLAR